MQSEDQFLSPAAVDGWFRLARAVVSGVVNPRERQEWVKWGAMRQSIRELNQTAVGGLQATKKARRMGSFEGAAGPARNKKFSR